jgi:hypothetical protein
MKNRPTKPGLWFYETSDRHEKKYNPKVHRISEQAYNSKNVSFEEYLCELEEAFSIVRWLGPAMPPPKPKPATVHEMVPQWLTQRGIDGLYNDEEDPCGCDGTAPCDDGPYPECRAAMLKDDLYWPIKEVPDEEN